MIDSKVFRVPFIVCMLISMLLSGCAKEATPAINDSPKVSRPNILLIVVDDVGYSDLGVYGSQIATPNIDSLASQGVILTQFHVSPNCGPTRGALMTGVDPHRAGMGGNHGANAPNQDGQPGYEGHLRTDVVSIAQLLHDAGYHTYMTGKWHLGSGENDPASRGFEKSFALLNGGASHWADQVPIIPGSATRYTSDGEVVAVLPDDFYSSNWYTDRLIEYIGKDQGDESPFFAFLSFTAPHNPLHVPQEYIDKYRGRFDMGWDQLALDRLTRMRTLGLVGENQVPHPRPEWIMAWDELSPEQKTMRARDMEIYAGMLDYVDESIGRVFEHLKQTGDYDNTLIVVMSDNGPSKTSITDYLALGGKSGEFFNKFDNSLENKGLPGSSTDIGPGWAYAAATPLRLFKGYVTQGGIRVPAVVKLPGNMPNEGSHSDGVIHVMDLMPTFLSVAGADYPEVYNGESIVPLQGRPFLPLLNGNPSAVAEPRGLGWSAYGMDAYRQGRWKVLRMPEPYGTDDWQLYDLSMDPGEVNDLASQFPERTLAMAKAWQNYADANGVIPPTAPTAYSKPVIGRKY